MKHEWCSPEGEEGAISVRFGFLLKDSEAALRVGRPVLGWMLFLQQD